MADRAFSRSQTMSTNWADDVEEDEELERGKPLAEFFACAAVPAADVCCHGTFYHACAADSHTPCM